MEIPYIAGFLDGEGCFLWQGTPRVSITNTYRPVLDLIAADWGGKVRKMPTREGYRQLWRWDVSGPRALNFISVVLPYLREKKLQAQTLLQIAGWPPHSESRRLLIQRLKDLKRINHAQ